MRMRTSACAGGSGVGQAMVRAGDHPGKSLPSPRAPSPPRHPLSCLLPGLLRRLVTHLALEGPAAQAHPCSVRFSRWIFTAETGLAAVPPGCSASGPPGVLHGKGEATNGVAGFSDVLLDLQPPVNLLFWAPCFALSSPRDLTKRQGLRLKPPADSSCVSPDQTSRASACNESLPGIHRGPQGQTLPPPPAPPPLLWEVDGSSILCLFMFPVWKSP
nr:uncharacterized protein LOC108409053 isoform X1 [Manis javanica]